MNESKADAILHPIRMKILQALARQSMTVQEMVEYLETVPQATLYRHLNMLKKHDIVHIMEEKQVRGTVEKRYTLNEESAIMSGDEAEQISKDDHIRYFMTYFAMILKQFEEYLDGDVNFEDDGFGYHQLDLYLNDEEYRKFILEYRELLQKYSQQSSLNDRKRTLSTVLIPEQKRKGGEENE
ncbi:transcriptional regulator [Salipaludibacillus keqinensis]|uniref:Transcriptional regulator n=1 Tax=Salipaludibacillus keqinensis TaxID=2045207 RepID=A0A323TMJ9_9BACI|nr:helix-turn-helix domain-containing protein [Salipaludibacillus keqinensis]PYZ93903.1 transcriptional regulator [Salipaludibacillus keqinensis]